MPTKYDSIELSTLFEHHEEHKLLLPNFQRDYVWKSEQQVGLLASMMVNIPVGAILILEGSANSFGYRELSVAESSKVEPKEPVWYLLDGQQRMSTLYSIFAERFQDKETWKDEWDSVYYGLKQRWFINIRPSVDGKGGYSEDIFGYEHLVFDNKIDNKDPDDLGPFIANKRVWKTKDDQWHHPDFLRKSGKRFDSADSGFLDFDGLQESRRRLETAKEYAERKHVPLFGVWSQDNGQKALFEKTLELIASNRADELKADYDNNKVDAVPILRHTDPDIEKYIRDEDENKINEVWIRHHINWANEVSKYLSSLLKLKIPYIKLPEKEVDRGIAIFEHMNTGGTKLDTFDLIVARAAADSRDDVPNTSLSQRVASRLARSVSLPDALLMRVRAPEEQVPSSWSCETMDTVEDKSPTKRVRDEYLSFLSILAQTEYEQLDQITGDHTRSKLIMELTSVQINDFTGRAADALARALIFLLFRCGISSAKDIPYKRMILPLGYLFADEKHWQDPEAHNKAEYWYWSSILSGAYRYEKNRISIQDIKDLFKWVSGASNPFRDREENVLESNDFSDQKTLIGYKKDEDEEGKSEYVYSPKPVESTILHYVLSRCPVDFMPQGTESDVVLTAWKASCNEVDLEDHHIYPLAQATDLGESSKAIRKKARSKNDYHPLNSPLNRTYISSTANGLIRDREPKRYMESIPEYALGNHLIPSPFENAYQNLSDNNYNDILEARYHRLRDTIKQELAKLRGPDD
jgi:hypothetical protein